MRYILAVLAFSTIAHADMMVIPASINFYSVQIGQTDYRSVNVYNTGNEAIQISATDFCYGDFWVTNWCRLTLRPGGSCNIDVRFSPRSTRYQTCSITLRDGTGDYESVHVAGSGRD